MKTTVADILNAAPILVKLQECNLSFGLSYKLGKILPELQDILKKYDEDKNAIVRKYADYNEENDTYSFAEKSEEVIAQANEESQTLIESELDLNIPMLTVEELQNTEGFTVKPYESVMISWLINEAA